MMRILFLLFTLFIVQSFYAINDNTPTDAASQALGGTSVVLDNSSALMNNPAWTATFVEPVAVASFSSSFGIDRMGLAAVYPSDFGALGFNVKRAGLLDYAEMQYGLFYARSFGDNFSAALQTDIFSVMPQSTAHTQWAFSGELALAYQVSPDLSLAFHLFNVLNSHYEMMYYDEQIPVSLKVGFAYRVFDNFTLLSELENNSIYGTSFRGGMEYLITPGVYFRTGGGSNPVLASLGLGLKLKNIHIDIAAQAVRTIGKTGAVSLAYTL